MPNFICEKHGTCCTHEFYHSIDDYKNDNPGEEVCDHLIEVEAIVRCKDCEHGAFVCADGSISCKICKYVIKIDNKCLIDFLASGKTGTVYMNHEPDFFCKNGTRKGVAD